MGFLASVLPFPLLSSPAAPSLYVGRDLPRVCIPPLRNQRQSAHPDWLSSFPQFSANLATPTQFPIFGGFKQEGHISGACRVGSAPLVYILAGFVVMAVTVENFHGNEMRRRRSVT